MMSGAKGSRSASALKCAEGSPAAIRVQHMHLLAEHVVTVLRRIEPG
jgi:hypothetical protein